MVQQAVDETQYTLLTTDQVMVPRTTSIPRPIPLHLQHPLPFPWPHHHRNSHLPHWRHRICHSRHIHNHPPPDQTRRLPPINHQRLRSALLLHRHDVHLLHHPGRARLWQSERRKQTICDTQGCVLDIRSDSIFVCVANVLCTFYESA
jgi:hypothetical protein